MTVIQQWISTLIKDYVSEYSGRNGCKSEWQEPLAGFVNASDERFATLKESVSATHALPGDLLPDARTVIVYFIPFVERIATSNVQGDTCSYEWAAAYIETNKLIFDLNTYLSGQLGQKGYASCLIPATHNFDEVKLISDWSHRHIAHLAGLGTFGLNNMRITEKGCCGRIGSLITSAVVEPTQASGQENCLYKHEGLCQKCISRCPEQALTIEGFDRHRCYSAKCLENARTYSQLGVADACGKCLVNVPCSWRNPARGPVKKPPNAIAGSE
ncbi:MAG: queG 3 [Firmicutes bacterium]|nr:queG 3 [Bacillota bacterium]